MAVQSGVYRGVSAQDRAAERRARLLEATLAVWADPEVRTTMTAVCAEAGLTERYFYESFDSLDDAMTALLDVIAVEIEQSTRAAQDEAGEDPSSRARDAVTALMGLLAKDPRKGRVAIIEAGALPALRPRRTALLRHFARLAAEEAGELPGLAHLDPRQAEVAGLLFVGGLAELVTAWLEGATQATAAEIADAAVRMFLGLYG